MLKEVAQLITNGTSRIIDDKPCVYYDGYWVRKYSPPVDTLQAKRSLIDQLTRRVFHHTEPGIATPGRRLDEVRKAYDEETHAEKKRIKGGMLAGALLHRASDIFTKIVELQVAGIEIVAGNFLLRECGRCFMEALELGKTVKHYSGEEGLDELWGEPMKAFSLPIEQFYETRYVKIAQTMAEIDQLMDKLVQTFGGCRGFAALDTIAHQFAGAAKLESETLRSDPAIFEVWPGFVTAGMALEGFIPDRVAQADMATDPLLSEALTLIQRGKEVVSYLATARVPMPKTFRCYLESLEDIHARIPENWYESSQAANQ
jgi:hypothetical protein